MTFTIHRGANEIGGSCVEINTATTRIVIDFGMPLVNPDKTPFISNGIDSLTTKELIKQEILPDIPSLFEKDSTTAVLISHSHQDHYGLIDKINPSCPVYLGKNTQFMIETLNTFTNKKWKIRNPRYIENGKKLKIGDIEITPYSLDHSAFESFSFLIEADGKTLLYSGDFRLHSRNEEKFNNFKANIKQNVDYFLMEGSTLGRTDVSYPSEKGIEEQLSEIIDKTKGINLLFTSGQNIDRLVSIYNVCKKHNKIFLIDFYTAYH
jgi:ribonuclease J